MIMKAKLYHSVALATLGLATLGGAYAASTTQNDALGVAEAGISLTQAVTAAEQHVGGKASRAEYEGEQGRSLFEVEVVKGAQVMDVQVDPTSGKVLTAENDKVDQGDDEDHRGGGEANEADD